MADRVALVIGISQYKHLTPLDYTVRDAEEMSRVLEQFGSYMVKRFPSNYDKIRKKNTVDSRSVFYEELYNTIKVFLLETAQNREALLYFSGHGLRVISDPYPKGQGYLCASDSEKDGNKALSFQDFQELIKKSRSEAHISSLVVILDCCHAGMVMLDSDGNQFSLPSRYGILAACRSHQQAYDDRGILSEFTKAILDVLKNPSYAHKDGKIYFGALCTTVSLHVNIAEQEVDGGTNSGFTIPIVYHPQPSSIDTAPSNFPLFLAELNYTDEHYKFRKFLETSTKVGAFWLSGEKGAGQKWLSRCLLNSYCPDIREKKDKKISFSMGAVNNPIYITRSITIEKVWERVGSLFNVVGNPDLIIDKIYEYSCNKATVVLSLIGVENLAPDVVEQIWEQLWKPLASKARSREADYPLILFLIDTGSKKVSSFDFLSGENEFQCNYSEKIVNLKLTRFDNGILNQWARQQEDSLQGRWRNWSSLENFMQEIIDYNSEDESCNEEVLEKICRGCGYDEDIIQNMIIR